MRGRLRLTLILIGTLVGLLSAGPAWAHSATVFYSPVWSTADRGAVKFYNDYTLTSSFLGRVIDGAKTWDKLGKSLDWDYVTKANLSRNVCDPKSFGRSLIYKGSIDGPGHTVAVTETCYTGKKLLRFTMRFDTAEVWNTSTATTFPADRTDVWSVAAHEFGHASGWRKHLDEALDGLNLCGATKWQQTMCSVAFSGSTNQRTLGGHDVHTFDAIY
jgi:hypothetical protein